MEVLSTEVPAEELALADDFERRVDLCIEIFLRVQRKIF